MPKNDKKKKNGTSKISPKKEIISKANFDSEVQTDLYYGQVTKVLGDCNFNVLSFEKEPVELQCHLRKNAKRTGRAETDSIVLFGKRDYQDSKGDIYVVYSKEQSNELKKRGEIPSKIKSSVGFNEEEEEDESGFDFAEI